MFEFIFKEMDFEGLKSVIIISKEGASIKLLILKTRGGGHF